MNLFSYRCATALILLAEEEAGSILEAEKMFKQGYKYAESQYKKSQQTQHQSSTHEALHRKLLTHEALHRKLLTHEALHRLVRRCC